jgi:hypothetical protein
VEKKMAQTQQSWKKREKNDGIQANTLLHMKLQPRLRVTAEDFDFTKDKLDMQRTRDGFRRNKKEER